MTQPSTINLERLTPRICKVTFSNPPANLIVPETVSRLHEVVKEMSENPQVQVAIFASSHNIRRNYEDPTTSRSKRLASQLKKKTS